MKKRLCLALLALLLALSLCTPAMAAVEYGVIYDETEALSSQALTTQGRRRSRSFPSASASTCGWMSSRR